MPNWKNQPIPESVRRTWPTVTTWEWVSPLRLWGDGLKDGHGGYLVVVDGHHWRALGQAITEKTARDAEAVTNIYAELRMKLQAVIGREIACRDGAPVRADHDSTRCVYCGVQVDAHQIPGDPGDPDTYQATHVAWPGADPITTVEAEAELTVELEAMKLRGRGEAR
ncbi:hypothetical protein [Nocardia tengchongensis]|uniref:hypothetical protein n=1 Tax=Nocardia tengchongensis TaxID=2055889 RepID=UPI00361033BF